MGLAAGRIERQDDATVSGGRAHLRWSETPVISIVGPVPIRRFRQ
jgi:hypothetical protein